MTTTSSTLGTTLLLGATLTTALVAGLLFGFAHAVMPGLGTLPDRDLLLAFHTIDVAIMNPWMMLTFLGSPVLCLAALLVHLRAASAAVPWLVVALVLVVATIVITVVVHLPLNTAVQEAASRLAAPDFAGAGALRERFEQSWVRWNIVRAATSIGSLAALAWALHVSGRPAG